MEAWGLVLMVIKESTSSRDEEEGIYICQTQENVPQMLLSRYFREELKQEGYGEGLSLHPSAHGVLLTV